MKNRFNRLTSKEWLPFQKSWFRFNTEEKLHAESIRFFTKADENDSYVIYSGRQPEMVADICQQNNIRFTTFLNDKSQHVQFAIIDLREEITNTITLQQYQSIKQVVIKQIVSIYEKIEHRRFVGIYVKNIQTGNAFYPFAWDLAKEISSMLSIKDEKIACIGKEREPVTSDFFTPNQEVFYCLYFRKDENSDGVYKPHKLNFFNNIIQKPTAINFNNPIPSWFILKPQPRKKNEILHPAKYPEDLVEMFVSQFSNENDNVFDPMSGTGSTQLGALKLNRNAYGTELSEFFAEIATNRCEAYTEPSDKLLMETPKHLSFKILNKDARQIAKDDFPEVDYMLTSPPYWDMLNMKGAENQAKRIEKGLQTNYSDNTDDLGNVSDYNQFLTELTDIYFNLVDIIKPGSYLTIVVKNIKKKGKNYPFAWDLSHALQKKLILLPEVFWCQDDISIAPYGYGNTWVSNTFHQYCLNFQKPEK